MASITIDSKGNARIQLMLHGERKSVRLGKVAAKDLGSIKSHIEALANVVNYGAEMRPSTAAWLAGLGDVGYGRLVAIGLVPSRAASTTTLKDLLDRYIASKNVKPSTLIAIGQARKALEEFHGEKTLVSRITSADAEAFKRKLKDDGKAAATVSKMIQIARAVFAKAVRWKLVTESPYADLVAGSQVNHDRRFMVPRADVERLLAACGDVEMRALIALARYGALRVPSEPLMLRPGDIDWHGGRITVRSPKTEGSGKVTRVIPLFPELRPHLQAAYDALPEGAEYLIQRTRNPGVNLRTSLQRLMARAGVKEWPKLWQSMRATRATELANEYPAHVAAAWAGHTQEVAMNHYWTVTDADYTKALVVPESPAPKAAAPADDTDESAVQIPAQHGPESTRTDPQTNKPSESEGLVVRELAFSGGNVRKTRMGATGFEPVTSAM
jgi:integrase